MTIDVFNSKTDDGADEVSKFLAGLISDGGMGYLKLGEGGWDLSAERTYVLTEGDGGNTYSGTILVLPVAKNTLTITADPLGSPQVVTDDGNGNFTGAGGSGTIDYKSGVWTVTFGNPVAAGDPVEAKYKTWGELSAQKTDQIATGDGTGGTYSGILSYKAPGAPIGYGTVTISDGATVPQTITDTPNSPYDGEGTFSGDGSGVIDYFTGEVAVQFTAAVDSGNKIEATYKYIGAPKAPTASQTDLESESDPDLYTFQKDFNPTTDMVFAGSGTGRVTCQVALDLHEGIDDGEGGTPYYSEGGLFSDSDVLLVYFTFTKARKAGDTKTDLDVDVVL
jgi:hypothetical protein